MKIIKIRSLNVILSICFVLLFGIFLEVGVLNEISAIKQAIAQNSERDPLSNFRRKIISDDEPAISNEAAPIAHNDFLERQKISWSDYESVNKEGCHINDDFFFNGVDEAFLYYRRTHQHKWVSNNEEYYKKIRPVYNGASNGPYVIEDIVNKYFTKNCVPVKAWGDENAVYYRNVIFPNNKIFVFLDATFISGDVVEGAEALGYIVFNSSIMRPLKSQFLYSKSMVKMFDDVLFYDRFMYPRIMVVKKEDTKEDIVRRFRQELLMQIDYFVARGIFQSPIWRTEFSDHEVIQDYGAYKNRQDLIDNPLRK